MNQWTPRSFTLTPASVLRVTATDADSETMCLQSSFVKSRRKSSVETSSGWHKRWDTDDFPLKLLLESLYVYFRSRLNDSPDRAAQAARSAFAETHPGLRTFLSVALDNYLEFIEERERVTESRLRYLGYEHSARVKAKGELYVWAPAYSHERAPGRLEIHRLHLKTAKAELGNWALLAAQVLANRPRLDVEHVTVADVALYHGNASTPGESIVLNCMAPAEISALYGDQVRPRVLELIGGGDPTPGTGCGECKVVGVCDALAKLDGVLHQTGPGTHTRSVSAANLNVYERCPARWFLEIKCRLPKLAPDVKSHTALARGQAVHAWLKASHTSGSRCVVDSLPHPDVYSVEFGPLDRADYLLAYPYLLSHLNHCPIDETTSVIQVDQNIYGWDSIADTAVISRPDLIYAVGKTLVIRETKTTDQQLPTSSDIARDSYDGIVYWLISIMKAGLIRHLGFQDGVVELEVLGHDSSEVYTYPTSDLTLQLISETRVRHKVAEWHHDRKWTTKPGIQCAACPVSLWCPDREKFSLGTVEAGDSDDVF